MKRKSILILAAVLMLAISLPVLAMAETAIGVQALDGTGNMFGRGGANVSSTDPAVTRGARLTLQDCDGTGEDCDCDAQGIGLGNDGAAQHLYARSASIQSAQSGAYCGSRFSSAQAANEVQSGRGGRRN